MWFGASAKKDNDSVPESRLQFKDTGLNLVPVERTRSCLRRAQRHLVVLGSQFVLVKVVKADGQVEYEIGVVRFAVSP